MGIWHGLVIGVGSVALCAAAACVLDRVGAFLFTVPEREEVPLVEQGLPA